MARRLGVRVVVATGAMAAGVILSAAPAGAVLTTNTAGCVGQATVTGKDGSTTQVNADDTKVKIPREGSAAYQGSVPAPPQQSYSGSVSVNVGGVSIKLGDWNGGQSTKNASAGTKDIPGAFQQALPGTYRVEGSHQQDGKSCKGFVDVEISGGLLGNPIGIAVAAGSLLAAGGLFVAGSAVAGAKP